MKQLALAVLMTLLLCGCNNATKEIDNNDRTVLIPEPDKAGREAYEKKKEKHPTFNKVVTGIPKAVMPFIPAGYQAINCTTGDANLDGITDQILVLSQNGEDSLSDYAGSKPAKRPLLLLLGKADSTYQPAVRNDNAVYCIDCAGIADDPFTGITIKNGYFSIEHGVAGGEHWEQVITFRYDKVRKTWLLYKDHYVSYQLNKNADPDAEALVPEVDKMRTAKDFGIVTFDEFDLYKEVKE